ncbi:cyclic nucleotide-binding domain-containing protein [Rubrobacter taiwanensis]|jgi:CRP/FNR family cyclic AMP-dependent transcriptional regulator|uniref:Cyclic nucleotide-binding domain-containing protein n=1 Tax=Rubrobacter taiwanensis TaxID=185139 RepID=A0A4R1BPZ3_9ACTN|nr:cyclic nucleotide-binding domain-containing protein [Rubrobacter taiwanensis]TCJ19714.1 cyclic nucleotide-binding domain-containing protein [Rubrobacter taiwanensis]
MSAARTLEETGLFPSLTPEERAELEARFEPVRFRAGEEIFYEAGPEEHLYVVVSGTVEVLKSVSGLRRQRLAVMEAPTLIGEMGLLTEPRAAASVLARTPVEARRIAHAEFLRLLEGGSTAAYKVVYRIGELLAERMARTNEKLSAVISDLDEARLTRDAGVFRDRLADEWF